MGNYVDNKSLTAELGAWTIARKEAIANNLPLSPLPEYVALCVMTIATKLSRKANWGGYSFRDELVSEGVENCVRYLHSFNPEKSSNGFAYITQICHNSFLRYVFKEQRYGYIKARIISNTEQAEAFDTQPSDVGRYQNSYVKFLHEVIDDKSVIKDFEERKAKHKLKDNERNALKRAEQQINTDASIK